jgi:glycosyltransferase involved in cell wall biosynthesis
LNRIALLIPTIDWLGGAERQVLLLAKGLARRNWRVTVVALSGMGGVLPEELSMAGVGFLSLRMRRGLADPLGWWRFNRWLVRNKPDVVHAHLPHAAWFARWSRLLAPGCVVVDTIHTSAIGAKGRQFGYRVSDWLADRVTAVSGAAAEAYLCARMVSEDHILVLPNGVDTLAWRPDRSMRETVRNELSVTDEFLWLATGRLEPVKDYRTLLRAFVLIREPARLAIVGGGSLELSLRTLTTELGIADRVNFLGFASNVRRWVQAADGFVLSSLWEGLPMGLLEAAACGLPAVATDVAGTREIVLRDRTGLLAPPGDVEGITAAMNRLMQMPKDVRHTMGNCARELVKQRYDLECILDRWEVLYAEILRGRRGVSQWKQLGET